MCIVLLTEVISLEHSSLARTSGVKIFREVTSVLGDKCLRKGLRSSVVVTGSILPGRKEGEMNTQRLITNASEHWISFAEILKNVAHSTGPTLRSLSSKSPAFLRRE